MKHILLAAAAFVAVPALAQTSPTTPMPAPDQTTTAPPPADASQPMTQTAPVPADPATTTTQTDTTTPPATTADSGTMPMNNGQMSNSGATDANGDPVGGYQPSQPALSGTAGSGAPVVFRAAPTPDQAYPAPAPLASYPICKKGQFDNCMQGKNSTHSREVRGRRSR